MTNVRSKQSFMRGAVILGAAGVIVKILGAFFRIPLANIIGDTGMAYYQTAYPVYVLLLAISTAGIPTAIARLVSEKTADNNHREAWRVFRLSFALLAGIGLTTSLILFFGASFFASFSSEQAVYSIRAIAPALLLISIMAAFRGYFQGLQDMMPTAVSQVVEQFFRVASGLSLAVLLLPRGIPFAAAGASFGAAAGGFFGLVVILFIYLRRRNTIRSSLEITPPDASTQPSSLILKKIVIIAVPITIGAAVMPVMSNIDLLMVPSRLIYAGFSVEQANRLYGQLSGFSAPLINIPQILTQSIALSLVPAIAAAHQTNDRDRLRSETELGLRMAMIVGFPCAAGMFALAKPLMMLLYASQKDSALSAAENLAVLAIGVVFLSSVQTLTGILQGTGKQMIPVRNLAIGAVVKMSVTYSLNANPSMNVKGAAAGTVAAYLTASILNMKAVRKNTGARFDFSLTFLKPGMAAAIMGLVAWLIWKSLSPAAGNTIGTGTAVLAGFFVYVFLILIFGAVTKEELGRLPGGKKLVKFIGISRISKRERSGKK